MKKLITLSFIIAGFTLSANNISVSNVSFVDHDVTAGFNNIANFVKVQFDITWENSWGQDAPTNNWDAAWVFIKYRVGSGSWTHAYLNNTGHTAPAGSTISVGLRDPAAAFNATTNPALGVFIHRSANGLGTFSLSDVELRWNYRRNPDFTVNDDDDIEIAVYAIEMVYVTSGQFFAGRHPSGSESGSFHNMVSTDTTLVSYRSITNANVTVTGGFPGNSATMWGYSTSGNNTIGDSGPPYRTFSTPIIGFAAFYCMKYEVSQQQYVDFLNSLTRAQQNTRTFTNVSGTSITNRFVMTNTTTIQHRNGIRCNATVPAAPTPINFYCDLNNNGTGGEANDGQWVACNYLTQADLLAYLDWSALRPMTEFEFEKACRGQGVTPIANEFPWGTNSIAVTSAYTLSNPGANNETIGTGHSSGTGNANIGPSGYNAPSRVGIFAINNTTSKVAAGAAFYGIMDMAGNVAEQVISVGLSNDTPFTGVHGNGALNASGDADELLWNSGIGLRGGAFNRPISEGYISDRSQASFDYQNRLEYVGGRGIRRAP